MTKSVQAENVWIRVLQTRVQEKRLYVLYLALPTLTKHYVNVLQIPIPAVTDTTASIRLDVNRRRVHLMMIVLPIKPVQKENASIRVRRTHVPVKRRHAVSLPTDLLVIVQKHRAERDTSAT